MNAREQIGLPLSLRRLRPRLVHFLSVYAPALPPRPYVITIHDLIHMRFPQYFKRTVGPYYRTVVRAACAGAARVITDDERTIGDLERYLGVPPRKVCVVPLGVEEAYRRDVRPAAAPRPYFLYVGNHRPHKDLQTLFSAWETLDPQLGVDLLLTGRDDLLPRAIRPRRAHGMLRFLGNVDSPGLASLYKGATALVHPALREGFGLPMLEAAATGCAIIACADAVPAVLGPYAQTFAPQDVRALRALMGQALAARQSAGDDAREFARTFTWDRCARSTAEVYRNVLEEARAR